VKILTQNMKEDEIKNKKKELEETAKKRIKVGLILNEFGEQNKIKVEEHEIQAEVQKQLRMMPGQEKIVKEYYEKNPSALASMRGSIYEEKIIQEIFDKIDNNPDHEFTVDLENQNFFSKDLKINHTFSIIH